MAWVKSPPTPQPSALIGRVWFTQFGFISAVNAAAAPPAHYQDDLKRLLVLRPKCIRLQDANYRNNAKVIYSLVMSLSCVHAALLTASGPFTFYILLNPPVV